jgi:hypothetical protein
MTFVEKDKKRLSPYGGVLLLSNRTNYFEGEI